MPIDLNDVQPAAAPAAPEPAAAGDSSPEIPEEVLRIPAFNGLLQGKPAAVYAPDNKPDPDISTVLKHGNELINSGFAFYKAKSLPVNVLYNRLFISDEQIKAADAAGELEKVAEPFDQVRASFEALRKSPQGGSGDAAAAEAPSAPPAVADAGVPPPASVQNKLATARTNALQPGSPNGAGRILAAIQKPVV